MTLPSSLAWLLLATQTPTPDHLTQDQVLARITANAATYNATLPSLTAEESIDSEIHTLGIFHQRTHAQATFRVLRQAPGAPLKESRQFLSFNNKPLDPTHPGHLPLTVIGAFGAVQSTFFRPDHLSSYRFNLLPTPAPNGNLQLTIAGDPTNPSCQGTCAGLSGLALLDPATLQITHIDRTITPEASQRNHAAFFVAVDFAPARLSGPAGDQTFWLPTRISTRLEHNDGFFIATYSNYRRFTASMQILPLDPDAAPSQPPAHLF